MTHWQAYSENFYQGLPKNIRHWLTQTPRLVNALKARYSDFQFRLLSENFDQVTDDEKRALHLDAPRAWLRQVTEGTANEVLVHSRVVVPPATFTVFKQAFATLGSEPIGNHLLYDNPEVIRLPFEFAHIKKGDEYDASLAVVDAQALYARRSIFKWRDYPLLVTEFFSNNLLPSEHPTAAELVKS